MVEILDLGMDRYQRRNGTTFPLWNDQVLDADRSNRDLELFHVRRTSGSIGDVRSLATLAF